MINLLGLCRSIRNQFPEPAPADKIQKAVVDYLGKPASSDTLMDLVKVLAAEWKRKGWTWDVLGAVKPKEDEEIMFHPRGLTIIRKIKDDEKNVWLLPVQTHQQHPRVIWF